MDDERFDAVIRALGNGASRRGVLGLLAGAAGLGVSAAAAKRRKRARGQEKTGKTTLCHHDQEEDTWHPITVSDNAVDAHAKHGDFEFGPGEASECCTDADCDEDEFCRIVVDEETGAGAGSCVPLVCPEGGDGCTAGGCGPSNSCICTTELGTDDSFCFLQGCGSRCTSSADCVDAAGVQTGRCSNNTGGCCGGGDCILFANIDRCDTVAGLNPAAELPAIERK